MLYYQSLCCQFMLIRSLAVEEDNDQNNKPGLNKHIGI